MSWVELRNRVRDSPLRAFSLSTVRAAISSGAPPTAPAPSVGPGLSSITHLQDGRSPLMGESWVRPAEKRCHRQPACLVQGVNERERSRHEDLRSRRNRRTRQAAGEAAGGERTRGHGHDAQRVEAGPPARARRNARGGRRARPGRRRAGGGPGAAGRDRPPDDRDRSVVQPAPHGARLRHHQPAAHRGHRPSARGRARGGGPALRRAELRSLAVRAYGGHGEVRGRPARHDAARPGAHDARRDQVPGEGRDERRLDRGHRAPLRRLLRPGDVDRPGSRAASRSR